MSKPARLYPKPEPIVLNPRVLVLGSGVTGFIFFVLGWTFQNIGVFVWILPISLLGEWTKMGLDMFLYGATMKIDGETCSSEIKLVEVAYWSKHNAIHNWMVENVQGGVDNCAMYSLTDSQLKELLVVCNKVLRNPTVENAMAVLPTKSGSFFGGTDLTDEYELEYYLGGLKYTVSVIKDLMKSNYEYYYYRASWWNTMFKIIVDGETVETVMYDDESAIRQYIHENYEYYGEKAKFEKMGE